MDAKQRDYVLERISTVFGEKVEEVDQWQREA